MDRNAASPHRAAFLAGLVTAAGLALAVLARASTPVVGADWLPLLPAVAGATLLGGTGAGLIALSCAVAACALDLLLPRGGLAPATVHGGIMALLIFALCAAATLAAGLLARAGMQRTRAAAMRESDELRTQAESLRQDQERLLGKISHELRTPLTAMLGWVQVLRAQSPPAQVAHGLEVIERNARAQTRIIDELVDGNRSPRAPTTAGGAATIRATEPGTATGETLRPSPAAEVRPAR